MMSIATAACAFCVSQTANAAETSTAAGVSATVNSSTNNSSGTSYNTETSSTEGSSSVTSSTATSNTTNGGGAAFAKGSAKQVKTAEPKKTPETANPSEQKNTAKSAKPVENNNSKSNSGGTNQTVVASNGEERSASIVRGRNTAFPAAAPTATGAASSNQSQAAAQQPTQITSSANNGSTANSDDTVWARDDFNISSDGKTIGLTGVNKTDGYPGLNAKGIAKLKKNPHIVIPDGVEVILNQAFVGHTKQVGDKREHIDGETYIEGVTLPDSLKVIEYGAFSWQKIKGTVVIPKNVIAIHPAAFLGNEIEKVVFKSTLVESGKFNPTDDHAYYVAGLGSRAFQGNKIKEIDFQGNLTDYKFRVDSKEKDNPNAAPFSNQDLGEFTIEVGEAYKRPICVSENAGHLNSMEGFFENGNPVTLDYSSYFKKNNKGEYIAKKVGKLSGLVMLYDTINGENRNVASARFTYNIIPKAKIYTVTFVNDTDQNYAKVQVKEGKSINDKSVLNQIMPSNPFKTGHTFRCWSTDKTGKDKTKEFSAATLVTGDMTVYAIYTPTPAVLNAVPTLIVQDKTITEGESLDLNSLIVSATDPEDGDITSKVKLTDNGGFDNSKVGSYVITFSVTDKGGASATAAATVTVAKKPTPPTPPKPEPTPEPEPEPEPELVPDLFVPVEPIPVEPNPEPKSNPLPAPAPVPTQPEQPNQQKQPEAKHAAKHLPQTGSATTPILASAIASLFAGIAGLAGLAESFAANRKRRN